MKRIVLPGLVLAVMAAAPAVADIGPPILIEVVYDDANPPIDGEVFGGELRITAAEPTALGTLEIASSRDPETQQEGWSGLSLDLLDPDLQLPADTPTAVRFTGTVNDATVPVEFSYTYMGQRFTHTLPMLPPREQPLDVVPPDVIVPVNAAAPPSTVGPTREALEELREAQARFESEAPPSARSGIVNVTGRLIYHRGPDDQFAGIEGATVRLYDDDGAFDQLIGVTTSDANGFYAFAFPFGAYELAPDLYIRVEFANDKVEIEQPGWQNSNYQFYGVMYPDVIGLELDMGYQGFYEGTSGRPIAHMLTWYTRAANWLAARGYGNVDKVGVWYPDGSNAHFSPTYHNIHIPFGQRWQDGVQLHEYGHHWLHQFADYDRTDYCNPGGYGDKPGDCGHLIWCPESAVDAWREGFPDWLSDAMGRTFAGQYSDALLNPYNWEIYSTCTGGGANFYPDPYLTEGALAALLRDIEDGVDPGDSQAFSPDWGDPMDRNTNTILDFVDQYKPLTPDAFLTFFFLAYGGQPWFDLAQWWEVCANNGYVLVDDTPPGVPATLTSTSHTVGVPDPAWKIRLEWSAAPDDFSGAAGYSVVVSPLSVVMPPTTVNAEDTSYVTPNFLQPGTYYAHVRAVDHAGNWSANVKSLGPLIVADPLPPDLNVVSTSRGWAGSLVPSDELSTTGSVTVDPVLSNETQGVTYFNLVIENSGMQSAPVGWPTRLYLDGQQIASWQTTFTNTVPGLSQELLVNWAPTGVPGGRHFLSAITDPDESWSEENEDDNYVGQQWVWNPRLLTSAQGVVQRPAPPDPTGGLEEGADVPFLFPANCDGLRVIASTRGHRAVVIRPQDLGDDYDARLHPPSLDSQSGFDLNGVILTGGWSSREAGKIDVVLFQTLDDVATIYDVGVINVNDGTNPYFAQYLEATGIPFNADVDVTLGIERYAELLQFEELRGNDGSVQVSVQAPAGSGPIHAALVPPEFSTGDMGDLASEAVTDADGHLVVSASSTSSTGQWGVLIWRDPSSAAPARATGDEAPAVTLTVNAGPVPANMVAFTPSGWTLPLVPRPTPDGTSSAVALPDSLLGGVPSTYLNSAWQNDGSESIPLAIVETELDGTVVDQLGYGPVDGGETRSFNSAVALTVPGGRHTLALQLDPGDLVAENVETDNAWARQWVWRPPLVSPGPFVTGPVPSLANGGFDALLATGELAPGYNTDGWRTPLPDPLQDGSWWQVIALLPDPGADLDLSLFESTQSTSLGFEVRRAHSARGTGALDYVAVSHRATPARAMDVGVLNLGNAPGAYALQLAKSEDLGAIGSAVIGPRSLGPDRIVDVVEVELAGGVYVFRVEDVGPEAVDWGLGIHRADFAYHDALSNVPGGASWAEGTGVAEQVVVELPNAGRYAVVVYKAAAADRTLDGAYTLEVDGTVTDAGPAPSPVGRTRITSVRPNPFNPRTEIRFDLQTDQRVLVEVFNLRGESVRRLLDAHRRAGPHRVEWNGLDDQGRSVASGVYFVRLRGSGVEDRRKVTLLK